MSGRGKGAAAEPGPGKGNGTTGSGKAGEGAAGAGDATSPTGQVEPCPRGASGSTENPLDPSSPNVATYDPKTDTTTINVTSAAESEIHPTLATLEEKLVFLRAHERLHRAWFRWFHRFTTPFGIDLYNREFFKAWEEAMADKAGLAAVKKSR